MQTFKSWPGVMILGLSLATGLAAETPKPEGKTSRTKGKIQTYYFMDWNDIEKGRLVAVLDASRLTEEAKKNIEQTRKDFGIVTRMGRHGTMRYHVPDGIKITVEKAKKTERWLVADQVWEDD